jgi:hypothetical protein
MERFMDLTRRLCFVVAVVLAVTALGQKSAPGDPFASVPADKREQLRADVERAADLQKHRKWKEFERVYDRDYPTANRKLMTQYELSQSPRISEFAPTKIAWEPKTQAWIIDGCVAYDDYNSNSGVGWVTSMTVRYVNGEARFLPLMLVKVKDQNFQRCRFVRHH